MGHLSSKIYLLTSNTQVSNLVHILKREHVNLMLIQLRKKRNYNFVKLSSRNYVFEHRSKLKFSTGLIYILINWINLSKFDK